VQHNNQALLSVAEVARRTGLSKTRVREMVAEQIFQAKRTGGGEQRRRYKIFGWSVDDWMATPDDIYGTAQYFR